MSFINTQKDESKEVNIEDGKIVRKDDSDDSTETDSESESEDSLNTTDQSPVSGSINYFVAPLNSSETQAMVIEELNQVRLTPCIQELFLRFLKARHASGTSCRDWSQGLIP